MYVCLRFALMAYPVRVAVLTKTSNVSWESVKHCLPACLYWEKEGGAIVTSEIRRKSVREGE